MKPRAPAMSFTRFMQGIIVLLFLNTSAVFPQEKYIHMAHRMYHCQKPRHFADLPSDLGEVSGMVYWNGRLWMHNDSGSDASLFSFDPSASKLNRFMVQGARNIDWEDIAQDEAFFYIGDFGNNYADRDSFQVYLIEKKSLYDSLEATSASGIITFTWPGYAKGTYPYLKHPFDCEAMAVVKGNILLIRKNHQDQSVMEIFSIPAKPGRYMAAPLATLPAYGPVTGADYQPESGILAILGIRREYPAADTVVYKPYMLFLHCSNGLAQVRPLELHTFSYWPASFNVQMESVAFMPDGSLAIANETSGLPQQIFRFERPARKPLPFFHVGKFCFVDRNNNPEINCLRKCKPGDIQLILTPGRWYNLDDPTEKALAAKNMRTFNQAWIFCEKGRWAWLYNINPK